jgi:superoxide reductase
MAERLQVYKCNVCGNIVEVLHGGVGDLVCCGEPMELLKENTVDAAKEKHVPVIEKTATGFKVKVGSVPHPMKPEHHIEWIELVADGAAYRQFLEPGGPSIPTPSGLGTALSSTLRLRPEGSQSKGGAPEAVFNLSAKEVSAREYCNLHGLWKS